MVIICPTLCISGCVQGSSELSYRQVAARDYRVPEGIDRHSVTCSLNISYKVLLQLEYQLQSTRSCRKRVLYPPVLQLLQLEYQLQKVLLQLENQLQILLVAQHTSGPGLSSN